MVKFSDIWSRFLNSSNLLLGSIVKELNLTESACVRLYGLGHGMTKNTVFGEDMADNDETVYRFIAN